MLYTYYTTARPEGPGAVPADGLESIENFDTRRDVGHCLAWARVTYSRPLDPQELKDYEMSENLPEFRKIEIPKLRDLSVACLKNPGDEKSEAEYIQAVGRKKAIYRRLFLDMDVGKIDIFYYDTGDGDNYNRYIFTHSAKHPGTIQKTCIWMHHGEEIPQSDQCLAAWEDFEKYGDLDDGVIVYYGIA